MAQGLRSDISLTQIRYFVRAAELGSMSRAAASLFVAQSAVSTSIANLERALGVTLFIRQRARGLELTSVGEQFLTRSRLVLRAVDTAVQEVDASSLAGEFTAGCFPTLIPFWMPSVCDAIAMEHPGLHTHVEEVHDDDVLETLRSGRLEVALAYKFHPMPEYITATPIATVESYAIVGESHPLADRDVTSIAELAELSPYVMLDLKGSAPYFASAINAVERPPEILHRFGNYEAVRAMVARGNSFSLLNQIPAHDLTYDGRVVKHIKVTDGPPALEIDCLYRADQPLSRKAQTFIDACRDVADQFDPMSDDAPAEA
ncbi:LysR family transcriptional regulator [Pseudoclavibacter endophyticus]|uniref:LysR family transcriptional regulator n=1 Tax=Pseudoclavibacter endophyticus TaxID=1778590 RepID=A0A6H9WRH7_9MICO|nr:LysR family transcriptional regulator [Pseudoclavibacter endophyticus]KAB1648940.1 LysR family transcriptional regulator [Pseudoclavibacter endophyticus]GGA66955.1 LysR family transcriptional regulator [Pseudoclavibacter endophyticus]